MKEYFLKDKIEQFNDLGKDLFDGLTVVQQIAKREFSEKSKIRLAEACDCALESLKDINTLVNINLEKTEWKLEYELGAIIETAMMQFYYWGIVEENPEKKEEFLQFVENTDTFEVLKGVEKDFPCDLTIVVTGYNKLEYTKQCVESVLENIPSNITYELVLVNHGSNDGTKEYFESVKNAKVINILINGALPGVVFKAFFRGKYSLSISNDIVVGKNAIENLYRSVMEHLEYGYVVPTTPAISNLQTISANYKSLEEFKVFTEKNNFYEEKRHEERVRLCNPVDIMPTELRAKSSLEMYEDKMCIKSVFSFPDDKNSLWMRRNGYKCILAKDAYCHHFGSVTLKTYLGDEKKQQEFYNEGREAFFLRYGVDPWGIGCCYDLKLFSKWKFPIVKQVSILGINCGLGSNSLKVKEILKENGVEQVILYNATQEGRYFYDLQGVSDEAFLFWDLRDIVARTGIRKYNYIVVEDIIQANKGQDSLQKILNAGIEFGELAWKTPDGGWEIVKQPNVF